MQVISYDVAVEEVAPSVQVPLSASVYIIGILVINLIICACLYLIYMVF